MFATLSGLVGYPQIQLEGISMDATAQVPTGTIANAVDPWWGGGEFIYAQASGAVLAMQACVLTASFDSTNKRWQYKATAVPNTANTGKSLCVSQCAVTDTYFSWFMLSGLTPVNCNASVAADTACGVAAAGQLGAIGNGKQIVNARVVAAASTTVAKAGCTGASGSAFVDVPDTDGWFPGVYISGTGIAAGAYVVSIDPGGRRVKLSGNNTASVNGTLTATYNNATIYYNVLHMDRAFVQGQIV